MSCSEWKEVKIEEIGDVVGGGTPSTKNALYYGGNISWITPKDLAGYSERYISKGGRMITKEGLLGSSAKLMPKNTVLFSSRAPIGYVAIAKKELCTNQGFKSIVPNQDVIDYMFLYYLLKYNKSSIESVASGTTFMEVSGTTLKNFIVKVPSLQKQKVIATTLSCLDDKIELNNRINKSLEEMTQAIFKSWFVDFEPFQDGEFEESELGMIPKGWRVTPISEFVEVVNGYSYKGSDLKPSKDAMLTIKNFDRNKGFKLDGFKELELTKRVKESHLVNEFDVLIACTDLTQNAEIIGNSIILLTKSKYEKVIASMDLVKINSIKKDFDTFFIHSILNDSKFKEYALGYTSGTTVLHLDKKSIPLYKMALPNNIQTIKEFTSIIKPMYLKIGQNLKNNENLIQIRDILLPKLMSGEIRVPIEEVH